MAEAFLQVLIENLKSLIQGEIGLILGVNKEMKKLSTTLITIQKVLEDAEDKQFQSKAIQNWLAKLNEVAFEIEDIVDECATEFAKLKHKGSSRFNLKNILYNYKIGRRMKEVAGKLDDIAADHHNFHLCETPFVVKSSQVGWSRETGYVVNEPDHIYGRDKDKEKIVDVLINQAPNCGHISVLPIIGLGGLGKTTLAQLVYNDERVTQHFNIRLWVCVSDNFNPKILLEAMIESATGKAPKLKNLNALICRLQQVLSGKKYLLILDDVWNESQESWVEFKSMLACGSKGSSIVVTTRLQKVGDIMRTLPSYCLNELSEEHCWLLFRLRAFGEEIEQQHPKLESIGRQIVKKCSGVPLAAKVLGGILRFKREEKEWIRIKESEIWDLPEEENSILPVLRLSYLHLPIVLKRCFAYCALYSKDEIISKQGLIFRWMAHGCFSSNKKQEVEDVGDQIWKEFVLRSFFQEVDTSERDTTFKMHDLIHDLAQSIMENKLPREETKNSCISNKKIREVFWSESGPYFDLHPYSSSITLEVATITTILKYNRLRILSLAWIDMEELPSAIGKLKRLRLLDLSGSSIHSFPHNFCCLWNLQTLILDRCYELKSLPKNIRYMVNLRHIFLEECHSLSHMPSRIRELVSLKTLNLFIVGDKIGNQLDELEYLNLGGKLEIQHLERVPNCLNAKKANLVEKPNLRDLILIWEHDFISLELANHVVDDVKVLEALEPHVNVETLKIDGFGGAHLPLWLTKLENLTDIEIRECLHCSHLPQLGDLPRLRSMILGGLDALEYIVGEDENSVGVSFPSLRVVILDNLPNLKGLLKKERGERMFPNLEKLDISSHESLILPQLSLSNLKELRVRRLSFLTMSTIFSNCKFENLSSLTMEFDQNDNSTTSGCNVVPEEALEGLCNLKELRIENGGQQCCFPKKWFEGLKSLISLDLCGCQISSCFPEGWLRHLTALEELHIYWCTQLVTSLEEIQNLHLLKTLILTHSDEMISLPQGLHYISTLQSLSLQQLSALTSLPDWLGRLPSLTHLYVTNCTQIRSLPSTIKEMRNLSYLSIQGCPLLERRCEKIKGEDWHIIAHIPNLYIGSQI